MVGKKNVPSEEGQIVIVEDMAEAEFKERDLAGSKLPMLFELKDVKVQLGSKGISYLEKVIFMAKETGKPQQVTGLIKPLIIWPSGKMMWKPPKQPKICKECGQVEEGEVE